MDKEKKKYIISCMQLTTIINFMPQELKNKIPKQFRDEIAKHKLKNYYFKYDVNKDLKYQDISELTRELLIAIYKDYLCDEKTKREYEEKIEEYYKKLINYE